MPVAIFHRRLEENWIDPMRGFRSREATEQELDILA
jgi:hypothetical protein